jgi:hypothetical protein
LRTAIRGISSMPTARLNRGVPPQLLPEKRHRAAVFWTTILRRPASIRTLPAGAQSRLRPVHHLLQKRHLYQSAVARAVEKHERQAKEEQRGLHDSHALLPNQLVRHEGQASAESKHFALVLFALAFELDHGALPQLVIGLTEALQLAHDGAVEVSEEVCRRRELALLDFAESVAEDTRLLLDVLQTEGAVTFELLKALVD